MLVYEIGGIVRLGFILFWVRSFILRLGSRPILDGSILIMMAASTANTGGNRFVQQG